MVQKQNETGKTIFADGSLDVRGESCPYPELYTLEALKTMHPGEILEVIADCPQSFINVPESAVKHGHEVFSRVRENSTIYFYIKVDGLRP